AGTAVVVPPRPLPFAERVFRPNLLQAVGVAVMVAPLLWVSWNLTSSGDRVAEALREQYPVKAVAVVKREGFPGPLYNHFDWGGYLIHELPMLPVAMDGRTNLHGDERLARHLDTWAGLPGWDRDPELSRARVVIAPVRQPLTELLRRDDRFRIAHEDDVAVVFVAR